jgi:hypothetical protein
MKNAKTKWLGGLGISACALCCALPISGSVVGLTAIVSLGAWLEKSAIVFLGLGAAAFVVSQLIKLARPKREAASCAMDCSCGSTSNMAPKEASVTKL